MNNLNSFLFLTGFEFRKILRKKSTLAALLLMVLLSVLSCWGTLIGYSYKNGEPYESYYGALLKDREYARALSGRKIDAELLLEASAGYATIPANAPIYRDTEEYEQNARRYSIIYGIARSVYQSRTNKFDMTDFAVLSPDLANSFYDIRSERQTQSVNDTLMSDAAKESVLSRDSALEKPITFFYSGGYSRFLAIMYTTGIIGAFVMALAVSPIFAGEYSCGADQLILSSKYGKGILIRAKLFTGFSIAAVISVFLCIQTWLQCMLTYGFDGKNAAVQLYIPLCPYPMTAGSTAFLLSLCVLFACLMTASVTMLLSAKLKSSFWVIVLVFLLLVIPMFINIPEKPLLPYLLSFLLPSGMMQFENVISHFQYELFGLIIPPYVMMPIFAAVLSAALAPFAYRAFKRHQVA